MFLHTLDYILLLNCIPDCRRAAGVAKRFIHGRSVRYRELLHVPQLHGDPFHLRTQNHHWLDVYQNSIRCLLMDKIGAYSGGFLHLHVYKCGLLHQEVRWTYNRILEDCAGLLPYDIRACFTGWSDSAIQHNKPSRTGQPRWFRPAKIYYHIEELDIKLWDQCRALLNSVVVVSYFCECRWVFKQP